MKKEKKNPKRNLKKGRERWREEETQAAEKPMSAAEPAFVFLSSVQ